MLTDVKWAPGDKAFSLIELLIAIGIMEVMLIPMVEGFTVAFESITHSKNRQRATGLAKDCLSQLKSTVPFSDLPVSSGSISCSGSTGSNPYDFPSNEDYSYSTNLKRVSGSGEVEVRLVQMRVSFPSPYYDGRSCITDPDCNSWDLTTLISER